MKKRIFSLILAITMLVSFNVSMVRAAVFPDVPDDHWAAHYISSMKDANIIVGYEDGTFKPSNEVKTGEFIKMLATTLWAGTEFPAALEGDHWSRSYVWSLDGVILEFHDYDNERLERVITRVEAAELICRFAQIAHLEDERYTRLDKSGSHITIMKDEAEISGDKERLYVDNCIRLGLINGFDDGTFKPQNGLTRAQAAKIIYEACR